MNGRHMTFQAASGLFAVIALALGISAQDHSGRSNPEQVSATALSQGSPRTALHAIIGAGRLEDLRWPNFPDYRVHVENFYRHSDYSLAWVRQERPTPQALDMIELKITTRLAGLNDWNVYNASLRCATKLISTLHLQFALCAMSQTFG
jgi:hypothetical protein